MSVSRSIFYEEKSERDGDAGIVSPVANKAEPKPNVIIDELIEARKKVLNLDSVRELGDKFHYDHSKIGKYRLGIETNPTKENITAMARLLGISREQFMDALDGKRIDKAQLRAGWLAEALENYETLTPAKKGEIAILVENLIEAVAKRSKA